MNKKNMSHLCGKRLTIYSLSFLILVGICQVEAQGYAKPRTNTSSNTASSTSSNSSDFQKSHEVTLTVLGTGPTEEDATLQALRSAIEQSFGAFVSANTTILNDQLIRDEIVSVSTGNVKNFKKLAVSTLPNKHISVSLEATVSVDKLISYAQSKGSRAEFASQAFSSNLKLMQLRVQSTKKALNLMVQQLDLISKQMFDFKFTLGDPYRKDRDNSNYYFKPTIEVYSNVGSTNFVNLLINTLKSLNLSANDRRFCDNLKIPISSLYDCRFELPFEHDYEEKLGLYKLSFPIAREEFRPLMKKVGKMVSNACFRYDVIEIGNPKNKYSYRELPPGGRDMSHVGVLWNEIECKCKGGRGDGCYSITSNFCLTEVRTPIKLTRKQQKEVEKGTYNGPTYTVSYRNPQKLMWFITELPVSNYSMDNGYFQGFELQYN